MHKRVNYVIVGVLLCLFSVGVQASTVKVKLRVSEDFTCTNQTPILLDEDLKDQDGIVQIPKGTPVIYGLDCQRKSHVGKEGAIKAIFGCVNDLQGRALWFKGTFESRGASRYDLSVGLTIGFLFIFGPFSPLFLLIEGEDTAIPKDTMIEVEIDEHADDLFAELPNFVDRQILVKAVAAAN